MPSIEKITRPFIYKSKGQNEKPTDKFYLSTAWRKLRAVIMSAEPLCRYCRTYNNRFTAANVLDHKKPRRLFPDLEFTEENLWPCCDECHNRKRAWEKTIHSQAQFKEEYPKWVKKTFKPTSV